MESKPGYKTTEFWLTLLSQLVSIAMMVVGAVRPDSQVLTYLGAGMSLLSGLGYGAARTAVKKAEAVTGAEEAKAFGESLAGLLDPP